MHPARPILPYDRALKVLLPIAVTLAAGLATAAEEPARLDEITVTARRTEERLLDVPIAVTAVSAETLEQYNIDGLRDLSAIAPSFYIMEFAGGRQDRNYVNLMFRGMNFFSPLGLVDAAVLFVDGAPVLGGQLATVQNIERIEVLPGPQTAQFGRNSMTGAVNVITKMPGQRVARRHARRVRPGGHHRRLRLRSRARS